jgi:FkbM family methyltransferase
MMPRGLLRKFAYSKFGSSLVLSIKKKEFANKKWYHVYEDIKMYSSITSPRTWDIISGKDPELRIKNIFLNNIQAGDIVFDVGANVGEYSLIASKKVGDNGKVICIEPNVVALQELTDNIKLNHFTNTEILNCAVGENTGKTIVYNNPLNEMSTIDVVAESKDLSSSSEIEVKTLDEIIFGNASKIINLLKMDIEGYEYEALLGCKNSFSKNLIKKILCEIHPLYLKNKGLSPQKIFDFLKSYGFKIDVLEETPKNIYILATKE